MTVLPPPRKQKDPQTTIGRCEKLFQSLLFIKSSHNDKQILLESKPQAQQACRMVQGSEYMQCHSRVGITQPPKSSAVHGHLLHGLGRVNPEQLQCREKKSSELPAHLSQSYPTKFSLLALKQQPSSKQKSQRLEN